MKLTGIRLGEVKGHAISYSALAPKEYQGVLTIEKGRARYKAQCPACKGHELGWANWYKAKTIDVPLKAECKECKAIFLADDIIVGRELKGEAKRTKAFGLTTVLVLILLIMAGQAQAEQADYQGQEGQGTTIGISTETATKDAVLGQTDRVFADEMANYERIRQNATKMPNGTGGVIYQDAAGHVYDFDGMTIEDYARRSRRWQAEARQAMQADPPVTARAFILGGVHEQAEVNRAIKEHAKAVRAKLARQKERERELAGGEAIGHDNQ